MKDFIKWLGVNEKVGKVVVWLFLILISLVVVNAALDSLGFPYYKITYDNLIIFSKSKCYVTISSWITCILNFYATVLLVFRVKESKKIFKYSMLYLLLNIIINQVFDYGVLQVFILLFSIAFCYFYSKKNPKYILYGIAALIINTIVQYICYFYKVRFIDYATIDSMTKLILSLDYFIIMAFIILIKEIYLNKRSEKEWKQDAGYGGESSTKKDNSPKKLQKN